MKKLALLFALALSLTFVSTGCSPRMFRGVAAAAIITGAVVHTAAEVEHQRRHHRRCDHRHYQYGDYYDCHRCH